MSEPSPLAKVCALLNLHSAKYLVIGARACILHGMIRTTEDVDIPIPEDETNHARVIAALAGMSGGFAAELAVQDLVDNVVVKIADEVEVDVSTRAWKVTYAEAVGSALQTEVEGVLVPYLNLNELMRSKETYRKQDQVDLVHLRELRDRRRP